MDKDKHGSLPNFILEWGNTKPYGGGKKLVARFQVPRDIVMKEGSWWRVEASIYEGEDGALEIVREVE